MAQRFVELTDAETNRAVWLDVESIVAMRVTMGGRLATEVTEVTYKAVTMSEVVMVKEMPGKILERAGLLSPEAPTPTTTIAVVGPHTQSWLSEYAESRGGRWFRKSDGARCVVGNEAKRFIGMTFDEVLSLDGADADVIRHVMGRKVVKS